MMGGIAKGGAVSGDGGGGVSIPVGPVVKEKGGFVGNSVGTDDSGVGLLVGCGVGLLVGSGVGLLVGCGVGLLVGCGVGLLVGSGVGSDVGLLVGVGGGNWVQESF